MTEGKGDRALRMREAGLSNAEIAAALGMSKDRARGLISEARARRVGGVSSTAGGNATKVGQSDMPAVEVQILPHSPITRRCKNKDCIQRFVPINDQHFFHEPACRESTNLYTTSEILEEEGQLAPDTSHLDLAKRAFGQKNQALRKVTQLTSLRDYLRHEVRSFYDENPEFLPARVVPAPSESHGDGYREVIVQLGDWQIGKLENGIGIDVMREERLPRIKQAIRSIVERQRAAGYEVSRAIISWGGDMIEGCFIYGGQNVTGLDRTSNTHRLTTQIRMAAHMQAEVALDVASYVEIVENQVVPGNHGRPNGKNDFADHDDNFDTMAAEWSSDLTANSPSVFWKKPADWWTGFGSCGHYVVSFHGDQWQGDAWKLETLLPQWLASNVFGQRPSLVLTHHRHDFKVFRIAGITVSQSGTIDGGSNWYLKRYGKSSPPSQTVIVTSPRRGVEAVYPIDFNSN